MNPAASIDIRRPPPRSVVLETARCAAVAAHLRAAGALPALDGVARAAARAGDAPAAAISLVGRTELVLVAATGFDTRVLPRPCSFCGAVVESEAGLLVTDAAHAQDHFQHELVRTAGIRAYAGVPLVDSDGYALGALGVFHTRRAAFGHELLDDLAALAALVEATLEGTRRQRIQGWLGIKTAASPPGCPGVIVRRVAQPSPAARAGLRPGDILHRIDHHDLHRPDDVALALAGREPGTPARLLVRRRACWLTLRADVSPGSAPSRKRDKYGRDKPAPASADAL